MRICSGVRHSTRSSAGLHTTNASACARGHGDVEAVEVVQELHPARDVVGASTGRHRVDDDRRLLALELVDGADRGRPRAGARRSRATCALYGATTRTSSAVSVARRCPVCRSTAGRRGPSTSSPTALDLLGRRRAVAVVLDRHAPQAGLRRRPRLPLEARARSESLPLVGRPRRRTRTRSGACGASSRGTGRGPRASCRRSPSRCSSADDLGAVGMSCPSTAARAAADRRAARCSSPRRSPRPRSASDSWPASSTNEHVDGVAQLPGRPRATRCRRRRRRRRRRARRAPRVVVAQSAIRRGSAGARPRRLLERCARARARARPCRHRVEQVADDRVGAAR